MASFWSSLVLVVVPGVGFTQAECSNHWARFHKTVNPWKLTSEMSRLRVLGIFPEVDIFFHSMRMVGWNFMIVHPEKNTSIIGIQLATARFVFQNGLISSIGEFQNWYLKGVYNSSILIKKTTKLQPDFLKKNNPPAWLRGRRRHLPHPRTARHRFWLVGFGKGVLWVASSAWPFDRKERWISERRFVFYLWRFFFRQMESELKDSFLKKRSAFFGHFKFFLPVHKKMGDIFEPQETSRMNMIIQNIMLNKHWGRKFEWSRSFGQWVGQDQELQVGYNHVL